MCNSMYNPLKVAVFCYELFLSCKHDDALTMHKTLVNECHNISYLTLSFITVILFVLYYLTSRGGSMEHNIIALVHCIIYPKYIKILQGSSKQKKSKLDADLHQTALLYNRVTVKQRYCITALLCNSIPVQHSLTGILS